jgi:DNA-binding SARP family transcriptional activator
VGGWANDWARDWAGATDRLERQGRREMAHDGSVMFRMFGEVGVLKDGIPIEMGGARERCLLVALLRADRQVVPRDELKNWIWDETPKSAVGDLDKLMTQLRGRLGTIGLGNALNNRDGLCQLDVPRDAVDVHRFRALVTRARDLDDERAVALLDEALGLCAGTPLAGIGGRRIDSYRHALSEERTAAELSLLYAELRIGHHRERVADVKRMLSERPEDSAVVDLAMRVLYLSGRQSEALRVYAEHRERLSNSGLDLPPALVELHRVVLRHEDVRGSTDGEPLRRPRSPSASEHPVPATELAAARDAPDPPDRAVEVLTARHLVVLVGGSPKMRGTALRLLTDRTGREGLAVVDVLKRWHRPAVALLPQPRDARGYLLTLNHYTSDLADATFAEDLLVHASRLAECGAHLVVTVRPELWRDCWQAASEVTVHLPRLVPLESGPPEHVHLRLTDPDGRKSVLPLRECRTPGARLSFGRVASDCAPPDIVLDSGPLSPVGRLHAWLEFSDGRWSFVPASKNPPRIRRRGETSTERIEGRVRLRDGDVIIVGLAGSAVERPRAWEIEFFDPQETSTFRGDDQ